MSYGQNQNQNQNPYQAASSQEAGYGGGYGQVRFSLVTLQGYMGKKKENHRASRRAQCLWSFVAD